MRTSLHSFSQARSALVLVTVGQAYKGLSVGTGMLACFSQNLMSYDAFDPLHLILPSERPSSSSASNLTRGRRNYPFFVVIIIILIIIVSTTVINIIIVNILGVAITVTTIVSNTVPVTDFKTVSLSLFLSSQLLASKSMIMLSHSSVLPLPSYYFACAFHRFLQSKRHYVWLCFW